MLQHLLRQLWLAAITLFGVVSLVFLIIRLTPGDPARLMLGDLATPEALAQLRSQLGLDRPIYEAYGDFLLDYARGDMGQSLLTRRQVMDEVLARAGYTFQLAGGAMLFAIALGIPLGVMAAVRRGTGWDVGSMLLATLGTSTPVFFLGIVFILLFSVYLGWLPAIGAGQADDPWSLVQHLILPSVALGFATAALLARITRSSLLEVLNQDYVRTARAKGLAERRILWAHALKNAAIPLTTVAALNMGYLIGGAVITETVFARPGLGKFLVDAIGARDYPVVQGVTFSVAALFILINLLTDLVYSWLDPRIRYS
ncbi:MAG: ABC transporter permease [Chloroflexi bacterium]|nr:ABC transporter permease [Chloroflexota bacterium]